MNWKTTTKKLSELNLIDNNPRTITEKEIKRLAKSIDDQGFFDPLVCDINGDILSGNQRYRVLEAKGIKEVEVTMPDVKLTEEQRKKVILLGNDHNGQFDFDILANEFEEAIRDLDLDIKLPDLDFSDKNKEVDMNSLTDTRKIEFKFDDDDLYFQTLEQIAHCIQKYDLDSNESLLLKLLSDASRA